MAAQPRGHVTIDNEECKGCGLCVEACPPGVLSLAAGLNPYGYHPATYSGEGCTGCGICFYCCPEPGAITVFKAAADKPAEKPAESSRQEAPHATTL